MRRQVPLRSFLLTGSLLGALLGFSGLYVRVVFWEWGAADELQRQGARVDSNFEDLYGLHLVRRQARGCATSLERVAARPTGIVLYNQVDGGMSAQLERLRRLRRLMLVGEDIGAFHLVDLVQNAQLQEIAIACHQIDASHLDTLAALPNLSVLDLCETALTAEALRHLTRMQQLDQLYIDVPQRRYRFLQDALPNTEVYRR